MASLTTSHLGKHFLAKGPPNFWYHNILLGLAWLPLESDHLQAHLQEPDQEAECLHHLQCRLNLR